MQIVPELNSETGHCYRGLPDKCSTVICDIHYTRKYPRLRSRGYLRNKKEMKYTFQTGHELRVRLRVLQTSPEFPLECPHKKRGYMERVMAARNRLNCSSCGR